LGNDKRGVGGALKKVSQAEKRREKGGLRGTNYLTRQKSWGQAKVKVEEKGATWWPKNSEKTEKEKNSGGERKKGTGEGKKGSHPKKKTAGL